MPVCSWINYFDMNYLNSTCVLLRWLDMSSNPAMRKNMQLFSNTLDYFSSTIISLVSSFQLIYFHLRISRLDVLSRWWVWFPLLLDDPSIKWHFDRNDLQSKVDQIHGRMVDHLMTTQLNITSTTTNSTPVITSWINRYWISIHIQSYQWTSRIEANTFHCTWRNPIYQLLRTKESKWH